MPDPKKKQTIVYAKGAKRTKGESNVKVPGARIVSKSTLKMKSKRGKSSEKFKSKAYTTSLDDNTVSRIKTKGKEGGKATETFKQIKKNKDGTYTLSKCNKRGKCTTRKVMKVRGKFITSRMKKNRDKLKK
jgi:hypothetical protein